MTSYEFTAANKGLFIEIAKRLNQAKDGGINLAFDSDWNAETKKLTPSEVPYVGSGCFNGVEGFYLKARRDYFEISSKALQELFPMNIDGFEVKMIGFSDFDWDDDRTWAESIDIAIFKDGKNVLENLIETVLK